MLIRARGLVPLILAIGLGWPSPARGAGTASEAERVVAILSRQPDSPAEPSFETLPELRAAARPFVTAYFAYSAAIETLVRKDLAKSVEKSEAFLERLATSGKEPTYRIVNPRTRKARETPDARKLGEAWVAAYESYRDDAIDRLELLDIDDSRTLVVVSKSDYLAYLVDPDREVALFYFPIAYGVNPYADEKLRFGDCRTPTSEEARITSKFAIARDDMNGIWMGLTVPNPDRPGAFWSQGGGVGMHGTPFRTSLGMKASHGCIRMFEEDSRLLAEYVRVGTRVVIWP